MSSAADLPDFERVLRGVPGRHALLIPSEVPPENYSLAVTSHFPNATEREDGSLLLVGSTVLMPPRVASDQELEERSIPQECPIVIDVETTVQRGDTLPHHPAPGINPIADIFADGMPEGVEWEVVQWLVEAARYLGGAVLLDELPYWPDPEALGTLTVISTVWLDPQACLAAVNRVTTARFPDMPPSDDGLAVLDGFAIEVPLGTDGMIMIEVAEDTALPSIFEQHSPPEVDLSRGAITYAVTWYLPDDAGKHLAHLSQSDDDIDVTLGAELYDGEILGEYLADARFRANAVLADIVKALHEAAGGIVVTRFSFPVLDTGR